MLQSLLVILLIYAVDRASRVSSSVQFTGANEQRTTPATQVGPIPDCRTNRFMKVRKAKPWEQQSSH